MLEEKKDPVDKPLLSSDEEEEGLDETLLTTKSIQTENAEDQSQQEDVPSKGDAEPVGLVGGDNKNKENKDSGFEDQTQTVSVKCTKRVQKGTNRDVCKNLYHFKCDGTTKNQVDDSGIFVCKKCRASCTKCDEFQTYKEKVSKEIINLKNNINELEKTIEHLNNELSVMKKQYEEVDQD